MADGTSPGAAPDETEGRTAHGSVLLTYNHADLRCARALVEGLAGVGVRCLMVDWFSRGQVPLASAFDERFTYEQNWHALFLELAADAAGVVVLLSENARESVREYGRGMWREAELVRFVRDRDPDRVREVEAVGVRAVGPVEGPSSSSLHLAEDRLSPEHYAQWLAEEEARRQARQQEADAEAEAGFAAELTTWQAQVVADLAPWARRVVRLGPIVDPAEHPHPSNTSREHPLVGQGADHDWYTVTRIDLYDRQWFCRRCGARSELYTSVDGRPPSACPACGFSGRHE